MSDQLDLFAAPVDAPIEPGYTAPALAAEDDRRGRYERARQSAIDRAAWAASGLRGPRPPYAGPSPCFHHRCPHDAAVRCCGCRHAFCLPCGRHAEHPCPVCQTAAGWSTEREFHAWEDCTAAVAFFGDSMNLLPPKDRQDRLSL